MSNVFDAIHDLEAELGLKEGFCWQLYQQDDDWSFVIKLHALIETSFTHIIEEHYDLTTFEIFQTLSLNGRISKYRLVSELHEMPGEYGSYIQKLSSIRNSFVHDIRETDSTLRAYVDSLGASKRQSFASVFHLGIKENLKAPDGEEYDRNEFVIEFPREAIFFGAITLLHAVRLIIESYKSKRETAEIKAEERRLDNIKNILNEAVVERLKENEL